MLRTSAVPAKVEIPAAIRAKLGKVPDRALAREAREAGLDLSFSTIARARAAAGIAAASEGRPLAEPELGARVQFSTRVRAVTREKLQALADACGDDGLGQAIDRLVASSAATSGLGRVQRERYKQLLKERGIK